MIGLFWRLFLFEGLNHFDHFRYGEDVGAKGTGDGTGYFITPKFFIYVFNMGFDGGLFDFELKGGVFSD